MAAVWSAARSSTYILGRASEALLFSNSAISVGLQLAKKPARFLVLRAMAEGEDAGLDSTGRMYSSRQEMWVEEAGEDLATGSQVDAQKKQLWYSKGVSYWEGVDATVDGVLGGYGNVSDRDVRDSKAFLLEMLRECVSSYAARQQDLVALDCGAGVGRVTRDLLLRHFQEVDLVEPVRHFLDAAIKDLKSDQVISANSGRRAVNFFCESLQNFTPQAGRYDVIWVQWCIGHLTDQDFVSFFQRAKIGLKPGGFFVLKENTAKHGFVVDKQDSSVTRSDAYFRGLFQQCGLFLLKTKMQKGFPRDLFSVRMYGLLTTQPPSKSSVSSHTRFHKSTNQPSVIQ